LTPYSISDKYNILFPWSLYLVRVIKRSGYDHAGIITMNFAKESLIENLNTEIYYSYLPNAFYGHLSGEYHDLPDGVSVLCGVSTTFHTELDINDKIALTLNAIFNSDFRTAFDYDYHDNPMFEKYVRNTQFPKYYEDHGYPAKEDHDEEYEEDEEDWDEPYSSYSNPIKLYEYLENVSLEDLIKENWGNYSNPLSFYVDYFKIKLDDQYFSDKKILQGLNV
jgi:hypothetical protein